MSPPPSVGRLLDPSPERVAAFSDAVFAIAMTLLAFDIRVPEVPSGELAGALLAQWVDLAAYALSFAVIGAYWLNHNRLFALIGRCSPAFLRLNLLMLLFVGLVAYATGLIVRYGNGAPAVIVYAALMSLIGLVQAALWWRAGATGSVRGDVEPALYAYRARRSLVVPVVFALSIPVALVNADAAKYFWLLLLVIDLALLAYGRRRPDAAARDREEI